MQTKTKDGKYFSQIGSWRDLAEIIFLVLVFKIFGIVGVVIGAVILYFIIPKLSKKSAKEADHN